MNGRRNPAIETETIFDYDTPIRITAPAAHILQMGSFQKVWRGAMAEMPESPPVLGDLPAPSAEERERRSSEYQAWEQRMNDALAYFDLLDERAYPITFNGAWLAARFVKLFPPVWDGGLRRAVPDKGELPPWARQVARHFKIEELSTARLEVFVRAVEDLATWSDGSLEPGERSTWRPAWLEDRNWGDPALPGLGVAVFGARSSEWVKRRAAECQHIHAQTAEEYLAVDHEQCLLDLRDNGWTSFRTVDDLHRVTLVDALTMEWLTELAIVFCALGEHCEIEELEEEDDHD